MFYVREIKPGDVFRTIEIINFFDCGTNKLFEIPKNKLFVITKFKIIKDFPGDSLCYMQIYYNNRLYYFHKKSCFFPAIMEKL